MTSLGNRLAIRAAFVVILATIAGCDKASNPAAPSQLADRLTIDAACAPVVGGCDLAVETERTFSAILVAGDGHRQPQTAQWGSDDATVASVDASGIVRGIRTGKTSIGARLGSLTAKVPVEIVARRVGYWKGEYVVRRCVARGRFNPADWCTATFNGVGTHGDFALDLRKDGRLLGGVAIDRSGSGLQIDEGATLDANGWIHLTARRSNGMLGPFLEVIDPLTARVTGDSLEGSFVWTVTVAGHDAAEDALVVEADLTGVTRVEQ